MSNLKGKTMIRSSFSILFSIRESKVRKNGNAPIEVTITLNGERSYFSTGKTIAIEKWDKTRQQIKGKDEEAKSLNMWKFYNLLTGANKSSYIDSFLDRSLNASEIAQGITSALHGDEKYKWFID